MTKPIGKETESGIGRMDKIEKLLAQGGKTVVQICEAMCLSEGSIRRYLGIMEDDGRVHVGDWLGEGRESRAVFVLGPAAGVIVAKRKSAQKKSKSEFAPANTVLSFAADPLLAGLFGSRRAA